VRKNKVKMVLSNEDAQNIALLLMKRLNQPMLSKDAKKYIKDEKSFDLHWWCVSKKDGSIIDPHFKEYDEIKESYGFKKNIPNSYKEFSTTLQVEILQFVYKNYILKKLQTIEESRLTLSKQDVLNMWCEHPRFKNCVTNAYGYWMNNKQDCVLRIGSMGWEKSDGSIWWEYG